MIAYLEWQVATYEREENYAARPEVYSRTVIALSCDHFWSGIAWRTAWSSQRLPLVVSVAETKVNDLDVLLSVK